MVWRRVRTGGRGRGGVGVWDGGGYADLSRQRAHEMRYIVGVGSEWREGGERGLERSLEALSELPKRGLVRDKCRFRRIAVAECSEGRERGVGSGSSVGAWGHRRHEMKEKGSDARTRKRGSILKVQQCRKSPPLLLLLFVSLSQDQKAGSILKVRQRKTPPLLLLFFVSLSYLAKHRHLNCASYGGWLENV